MNYNKVIYVERGIEEVSAHVSALITRENGRLYLSNFNSDYPLHPAEQERAEEELIERARCYPETGYSN